MKKIAIGFLVLLLILGAGAVALVTLVNTDDIKAMVQSQVYENTGRDLLIDGDIKWQFFPTLGLSIGKTVFKNHPDFDSGNTLSVEGIQVSVSVMPLLSRQLELGTIALQGARFNLTTMPDGSTNLDDLQAMAQESSKEDEVDAEQPDGEVASESSLDQWQMSIAGIDLQNLQIMVSDLGAKTEQTIGPINLTLDSLALDQASPLAFSLQYDDGLIQAGIDAKGQLQINSGFELFHLFGLEGVIELRGESIPNQLMQLSMSSDLVFNRVGQHITLSPLQLKMNDKLELAGDLAAAFHGRPELNFNLASPEIVTQWLLGDTTQKAPVVTEEMASDSDGTAEPDLTVLQTFDLNGQLSVDSIKHDAIKLENVKLSIDLNQGLLQLVQLTTELYEGQLISHGQLNANHTPATYTFDASLSDVQAEPLLTDAAELDLISGTLSLEGEFSGKGLAPDSLLTGIQGKISSEVTDGSLNGVNIPLMIRQAKSKLGSDSSTAVEKTDFSSLTTEATLGNGVAKVTSTQMSSPLLRVEGEGETHLVKQTLDFDFTTKLVASLEGQGGSDDAKGVTIPLHLGGSWTKPSYNIDLEAMFEEQAKEEVKTQIKEQLDGELGEKINEALGEDIGNKLKGLFN